MGLKINVAKPAPAAKGPPPKLNMKGTTVDASDLGSLLDKYKVDPHYGETLPSIYQCSLDIQGGPKSGKSSFLMGNPYLWVAKLPDGSAVARRKVGRMHPVNSLTELEDWWASMLEYGSKYGQTGNIKTIGVDPTFKLVEWLQDREVTHVNEYGLKGDTLRNQDGERRQYDHISEIPNPSIWGKVSDYISQMIGSAQAVGLGVAFCTHYKKKLVGDVKQGGKMEWVADIQPTAASAIAKITDVLVVTRRLNGKYFIEFSVDKPKAEEEYLTELSSRIPLEGVIELPDYASAEDLRTSWQLFEEDYAKVQKAWNAEVLRFKKHHGIS